MLVFGLFILLIKTISYLFLWNIILCGISISKLVECIRLIKIAANSPNLSFGSCLDTNFAHLHHCLGKIFRKRWSTCLSTPVASIGLQSSLGSLVVVEPSIRRYDREPVPDVAEDLFIKRVCCDDIKRNPVI